MKVSRVRVLAAASVVSLLAACGANGSTETESASGMSKVTIAAQPPTVTLWAPLYLADSLGYFEDEGVEVDISQFSTGGSTIGQAVVAGEADYGFTLVEIPVTVIAAGKDLKVLGSFLNSIGGQITARSNIDSFDELAGHPVGVTALGAGSDIILRYTLGVNGMSAKDVNIVPAGGAPNLLAGFDSGSIDAAVAGEPLATIISERYDTEPLLNLNDLEAVKDAYGGWYPGPSLYSTGQFAEGNVETTAKVLRAMTRANEFILSSSPEELRAALPADMLGENPEMVLRIMQETQETLWRTSPLVDDEAIDRVVELNAVANEAVAKGLDDGVLGADNILDMEAASLADSE